MCPRRQSLSCTSASECMSACVCVCGNSKALSHTFTSLHRNRPAQKCEQHMFEHNPPNTAAPRKRGRTKPAKTNQLGQLHCADRLKAKNEIEGARRRQQGCGHRASPRRTDTPFRRKRCSSHHGYVEQPHVLAAFEPHVTCTCTYVYVLCECTCVHVYHVHHVYM